jgi:nucleoside phosphorylase
VIADHTRVAVLGFLDKLAARESIHPADVASRLGLSAESINRFLGAASQNGELTVLADGRVKLADRLRGQFPAGNDPALVPDHTSESHSAVDLLLVTVNAYETDALMQAFQQSTGRAAEPVPIDDRLYRDLGVVNSTRCFHALSEMGSGGLGATQQTVDKAIRALCPQAVLSVGIAFGVNERKQKIGEILISRQLRLYDLQRRGAKIILRGDKPHASTRLINFFDGFAQTTWEGAKAETGLILTGDTLVDDIDYRDQLITFEEEAIGGEMEGAGVYVSCQEHKVDWIVIKAICDWGDGKKSVRKKARQTKAAQSAMSFVMHALEGSPLSTQLQRRRADTQCIPAVGKDKRQKRPMSWTGPDIAEQVANKVVNATKELPARGLLREAARLFARPAFYPHPERHYGYGLYAVVITRLVWEQVMMPRLRPNKENAASMVLQQLLTIEHHMAKCCRVRPKDLTAVTASYIHSKEEFVHNLGRKTDWYGDAKAETQRAGMLDTLREAVKSCGITAPSMIQDPGGISG